MLVPPVVTNGPSLRRPKQHDSPPGRRESAANATFAESHELEFSRDVGRMAVYPYFRAHVAILVSSAGVVLPPLPSINIGTFRNRNTLVGKTETRGEQQPEKPPEP